MKSFLKNYVGMLVGIVIGATIATIVTMIVYGYTPNLHLNTANIEEFQKCISKMTN